MWPPKPGQLVTCGQRLLVSFSLVKRAAYQPIGPSERDLPKHSACLYLAEIKKPRVTHRQISHFMASSESKLHALLFNDTMVYVSDKDFWQYFHVASEEVL